MVMRLSCNPASTPPVQTQRARLLIRSVAGRDVTMINAQGRTRCAYFPSHECVLEGFTLANGHVGNASGGGVWGGTINKCLIVDCKAEATGGGATLSHLNDCILYRNVAYWHAGGASQCKLTNCEVVQNDACSDAEGDGGFAGGVCYCALDTCVIRDNVGQRGGGAGNSTLRNCSVAGNISTRRESLQCDGIETQTENCVIREEDTPGKYAALIEYFEHHPFGAELPTLTLFETLPPRDRSIVLEALRSEEPSNAEIYNRLSHAYLDDGRPYIAYFTLDIGAHADALDTSTYRHLRGLLDSVRLGGRNPNELTVCKSYRDTMSRLMCVANAPNEFHSLLVALCRRYGAM